MRDVWDRVAVEITRFFPLCVFVAQRVTVHELPMLLFRLGRWRINCSAFQRHDGYVITAVRSPHHERN